LFRINSKKEVNDLEVFETGDKVITLIEWPELIDDKGKIKFIKLTFSYLNNLVDRSVDIKI